jgi:hypothetical protein
MDVKLPNGVGEGRLLEVRKEARLLGMWTEIPCD